LAFALDGAKAAPELVPPSGRPRQQFGRQAVKIELLAHTRRERFDRVSVNCSTAALLAL
jgi:hypothetical protein